MRKVADHVLAHEHFVCAHKQSIRSDLELEFPRYCWEVWNLDLNEKKEDHYTFKDTKPCGCLAATYPGSDCRDVMARVILQRQREQGSRCVLLCFIHQHISRLFGSPQRFDKSNNGFSVEFTSVWEEVDFLVVNGKMLTQLVEQRRFTRAFASTDMNRISRIRSRDDLFQQGFSLHNERTKTNVCTLSPIFDSCETPSAVTGAKF